MMEPWLHKLHYHCPICGCKYLPNNLKNLRYKMDRFKVQPFFQKDLDNFFDPGAKCVYHLCYGCLQNIMKEKVTDKQSRFVWNLDGDNIPYWYYQEIFSCFWHIVEDLK